jgi:hypothetical protein
MIVVIHEQIDGIARNLNWGQKGLHGIQRVLSIEINFRKIETLKPMDLIEICDATIVDVIIQRPPHLIRRSHGNHAQDVQSQDKTGISKGRGILTNGQAPESRRFQKEILSCILRSLDHAWLNRGAALLKPR